MGRSRGLDGSGNGVPCAGEGFAAVAVVAELAEAGRGRRQQDHPAWPGPPASHRYPAVTAASRSGQSVTPAKATARISSLAPTAGTGTGTGTGRSVRLWQPGSLGAVRLRRRGHTSGNPLPRDVACAGLRGRKSPSSGR
jgi:hypothetical protein